MRVTIVTAKTIAVGDIVGSERFVYGRTASLDPRQVFRYGNRDFKSNSFVPILVGLDQPYIIDRNMTVSVDCDGVAGASTEKVPPNLFDCSAPQRSDYRYVVISIEDMWRDRDPGDDYDVDRTGRRVVVERMDVDGAPDPHQELLQFWMTGPFKDVIPEVLKFGHIDIQTFIRDE
jgi:hypothetical protein